MPVRTAPPSYRHHKARGQAVVRLSGRDVYLGPYGTQVSRDNYDRAVAEWLANGRALPEQQQGGGLLIADLVDRFTDAEVLPASHLHEFKLVFKDLIRLYGVQPVEEFGPLKLKAVRTRWVEAGLKRLTINERVNKLRRVFRWGVSEQLVSESVLRALESVDSLAAGRTKAPESVEVEPVSDEQVKAVLDAMPPMLAAMVQIQHLTGMRGKEILSLRTCDIDTRGEAWVYRPADHKTKHKKKIRQVSIGLRAKKLLEPWLLSDLQAIVFSPARAEALRLEASKKKRKTPLSCGNRSGRRSTPRAKSKTFQPMYKVTRYALAIARAIERVFPPPAELARQRGEGEKQWRSRLGPKWEEVLEWRRAHRWGPRRLRHAFGQRVRDEFSLDHAQAALGHSSAKITEVYAQVKREKADEVALKIG